MSASVESIANRMASCGHDHDQIIKLVSEDNNMFEIEVYDRHHPQEQLFRYKFTRLGSLPLAGDQHEMVRLEEHGGNGWVMEAIPALMFAAIYAGDPRRP